MLKSPFTTLRLPGPFARRRGRGFTPASLVASGEHGALLQAPDLSTLYTDDEASTQAGVGDPVAVWEDESGNGNDATQTTLSSRMIVSGDGPYYLNPDGDDDNFSIPLGAGFTGDFCLILDTGPIFGSIDTAGDATWNYTVNPAYIPDGKIHALIVVDRALTAAEKQGLVDYYADAATSVPSTANQVFRDRTDLTALDASYGDWTQVTNARAAFFDCSSLTAPPDVSGWTQVTNASFAFSGCSSLATPPDVSGWTQVTDAESAFRRCSSLTSPPDVSGWTQVTNAQETFISCSSITTPPDVSSWTQVTDARSTFNRCSGLTTTPDVSGWTQVTNAFAVLYKCSSLTAPPDVSGWNQVTDARFAFQDCSNLTSAVNLDSWNPTILTAAGDMMSGISAAGFDQTAYDSALTAWDAAYDLTTVNAINIHFGSAQYGSGAPTEARDKLIAAGWTITDGGAA